MTGGTKWKAPFIWKLSLFSKPWRFVLAFDLSFSISAIKLGRRSKNEKVILSKDCEKSTARGGNSLMTFISPRSLTNPITPFSPYPDLKSPLKSFGTSPSYNVSTDGYLSTHRPSNYGLSFDYSSYRPDAHNFYVPTQPNTGGIYSGINPMEPMNSFDLYASSATNHSAVPPTSVPQLAALGSTNSASSLLPNISMPKLEPMTGNDLQLTTSQRETTLSHVSTAQNPISSPNYTIATGSDISGSASANFNSHFLTHPSSANGHHGFFSTNHSDSLTNFANHNSVHSTGHGTNSWSIIDHIVTYWSDHDIFSGTAFQPPPPPPPPPSFVMMPALFLSNLLHLILPKKFRVP